MLLELNVRNLGIIENTNWQLAPGLNIITGETGAGKSLVIDAVEALLGARTGEDAIRHGYNEAVIEGIFAFPENDTGSAIASILQEKEISVEHDTLIISCSIRKQGRSVFRINSHAVPKTVIHQIGRMLIDIHGQSDHLGLLDYKYHLDFLDAFGNLGELRHQFAAKLAELRSTEQEIDTLNKQIRDRAQREDLLRFQIDEIQVADLQENEDEILIQERQVLSSTEKLKSLAHLIFQSLSGDESQFGSTLDNLHRANRNLQELIDLDPRLAEQAKALEEIVYSIEDISRDVYSYGDSLEFDLDRLTEIESRLDIIRNLKRKYGQSIDEIMAFLKEAKLELEGISFSDERLSELKNRCAAIKTELGRIAAELSENRTHHTNRLVTAVQQEIDELNMKEVAFDISFLPLEGDELIPIPSGDQRAFGNDGIDSVEFMASTNPGEPLKPLAKIASTGETSRFMLALKSALAQSDNTPVVVFDEIDIGVGGRSGEILGKKLWALAQNRQVICVTHLPQIASFADAHFGVHKEFANERTSSILKKLDAESRLKELAAMIAGPEFSDSAIENARDLLDKASSWKKNVSKPS